MRNRGRHVITPLFSTCHFSHMHRCQNQNGKKNYTYDYRTVFMQSLNRHRCRTYHDAKTIDGQNETNGIKVNPREYIGLVHKSNLYTQLLNHTISACISMNYKLIVNLTIETKCCS